MENSRPKPNIRHRIEPEVEQAVIVTLCGLFNQGEVLNCAVEFGGPVVAGLSIDERLAIINMTTEWGALPGWFPVRMPPSARRLVNLWPGLGTGILSEFESGLRQPSCRRHRRRILLLTEMA